MSKFWNNCTDIVPVQDVVDLITVMKNRWFQQNHAPFADVTKGLSWLRCRKLWSLCWRYDGNIWRFPARHGGTPIAGWFISWKIPLKWMIGEYPSFRKLLYGRIMMGRRKLTMSKSVTVLSVYIYIGMNKLYIYIYDNHKYGMYDG